MDPSTKIDALLNEIEKKASDVSTQAEATAPTAGDVAAVAGVAGTVDEIVGEITPAGPAGQEPTLAGEFAAPSVPAAAPAGAGGDVRRLLAIEVPVIVLLGQRRMTVGEVMRLGVGAIVEFSKSAEEELDLLVNNKPIGRGHAVKVGENFGIRLSGVTAIRETIRKLGGIAD